MKNNWEYYLYARNTNYSDHCKQASFNLLTTNVPHSLETSQLICNAIQLTGFYMMGDIGR